MAEMCRRKAMPLITLVLGSTYILCGSVQMVAGILFLLLPAVLHTGSNTWTGILTILAGTLLLNISRRHRLMVVLSIHLSIFIVNLGNLLLMELGEWRLFLRVQHLQTIIRKGHIKFLAAAYLSTAIPTVIVVVVSFLAAQYNCCLCHTTRKPQTVKAEIGTLDSTTSSNFDWVFQEDQWTSHELITERKFDVSNHSSLTEDDPNIFCLQTFSSPFQETPTSFRPSNWSTRLASRQQQHSNYTKPMMMDSLFTNLADDNTVNEGSIRHLQLRPPDADLQHSFTSHSHYADVVETCPPQPNPSSSPGSENLRTKLIPASARKSKVQAPDTLVVHSSKVPKAKWHLPSRPLFPVDNDTLVHLSRLELLARHWRFQSQHKSLERQIELRLNAQRAGFSYTNA